MMRHVDLCSGIGGFALGFEWAGLSRPVMFCDIEPWSRKVLAKHWPDVPIEEDVKVLANDPTKIPAGGANTILTAGYPCQPFSQAGKRRGEEDDRHIWPYIREIVAQKRPAWCVFENVYGHVSMGLDTVLSNLEADGYATRAHIVPACGVDAPHRRDRVWIIARNVGNTEHDGQFAEPQLRSDAAASDKWRSEEQKKAEQSARTDRPIDGASLRRGQSKGEQNPIREEARPADVGNTKSIGRHGWAEEAGRAGQTHQPDEPRPEVWGKPSGSGEDVADTSSIGPQGCAEEPIQGFTRKPRQSVRGSKGNPALWPTEPAVGRVAHGIPRRVDRIKGLGNAIVPQIAMQIGIAIRQCEASATGQ